MFDELKNGCVVYFNNELHWLSQGARGRVLTNLYGETTRVETLGRVNYVVAFNPHVLAPNENVAVAAPARQTRVRQAQPVAQPVHDIFDDEDEAPAPPPRRAVRQEPQVNPVAAPRNVNGSRWFASPDWKTSQALEVKADGRLVFHRADGRTSNAQESLAHYKAKYPLLHEFTSKPTAPKFYTNDEWGNTKFAIAYNTKTLCFNAAKQVNVMEGGLHPAGLTEKNQQEFLDWMLGAVEE